MNYKGGKQERICKICKNIFLVYPGNKSQKSCSRACSYSDPERGRKIVSKRMSNGGYNFSKETRERMSASQTGRVVSDGTKSKLSELSAERNKNGGKVNQYGTYKGGYMNKLRHNLRRVARKLNAQGDHTFEQWEDLKMKYGYKCVSCLMEEPSIFLTEDHIIPLIKGGSDYIENIQPLCKSCNCKKHTKATNYLLLNDI